MRVTRQTPSRAVKFSRTGANDSLLFDIVFSCVTRSSSRKAVDDRACRSARIMPHGWCTGIKKDQAITALILFWYMSGLLTTRITGGTHAVLGCRKIGKITIRIFGNERVACCHVVPPYDQICCKNGTLFFIAMSTLFSYRLLLVFPNFYNTCYYLTPHAIVIPWNRFLCFQ